MLNILVADDEPEIIELISLYISDSNMNILKASNGQEAFEIIKENNIALGIIDIMMPKLNGFQLIEKIRKEYTMPLIILSAREDYSDKIHGLQIGADDYMTKPFNSLELKARIEAHLRRTQMNSKDTGLRKISLEDLEIDIESCEVTRDKEVIDLTSKE